MSKRTTHFCVKKIIQGSSFPMFIATTSFLYRRHYSSEDTSLRNCQINTIAWNYSFPCFHHLHMASSSTSRNFLFIWTHVNYLDFTRFVSLDIMKAFSFLLFFFLIGLRNIQIKKSRNGNINFLSSFATWLISFLTWIVLTKNKPSRRQKWFCCKSLVFI